MNKWIVILMFGALSISCKDAVDKIDVSSEETPSEVKNQNKLKQLDWLLGAWQNVSEEGISREIWSKENDSVYLAESFTIVENDTVFSEKVKLFQSQNEVYFSAVDAMQNGGKAVAFKMIPDKPGLFVFENNLHDFPKRIIYTNPVKDSIHAWIVGLQEGEFRKVDFYFERVSE